MSDERDDELDTEFEEELLEQGLKYISPDKFLELIKSSVSSVIGSCTDMRWFGENYLELKLGKDNLIFPVKSVIMTKDEKGVATFQMESVPKTELRKSIRKFYSDLIEDEIEKRVKQRLKTQEK